MHSEKLAIELVPSETDEPLRSIRYQADLSNFAKELRTHGMNPSMRMHFEESVESHSFLLGGFSIEFAKVIAPALCTAVGVWVHAKCGRKVRLKIGELEAEAQTVEEVKQLLEYANQRQEPLE